MVSRVLQKISAWLNPNLVTITGPPPKDLPDENEEDEEDDREEEEEPAVIREPDDVSQDRAVRLLEITDHLRSHRRAIHYAF